MEIPGMPSTIGHPPFNADMITQCGLGVYPFMFGSIKDFEPVFDEMIKVSQ